MSIPISSRKIAEVAISLLLAVAIMYWIYKDFPFSQVSQCLQEEVQWGWMALSLVFGIIPQIIRGIRWRMALTPVGENPALRNCLSAVYMSFAASLIIPRIGEISRCATLKKTDGTSFPVALGTVVTERIIDSLLVLLIVSITFLCELPAFYRFLTNIDLDIHSFFATFSITGCIVSLLCTCLIIGGLVLFFRHFQSMKKFQDVFQHFSQGLISIKRVQHPSLFIILSIAIWICYFLHFYLAFFALPYTSHLGIHAGLLSFCMITIAVLVPPPNGAGPWHFAVKVVLMQFGISIDHAIMFALIVHALQTLLVILLGLYGYLTLKTTSPTPSANTYSTI